MQVIEEIIREISGITLKDAEGMRLFDRIDSKYIFHISLLPDLLNLFKVHYKILEVNEIRNQSYRSLYFDTNDRSMYFGHHNGHLNRYKIRFREYLSSKACFLEIKFRSNQDRTQKKRCDASEISSQLTTLQISFLERNAPYVPALLVPQTWTNFHRITLIHNDLLERVTIDTLPEWQCQDKKLMLPSLVIAEVKKLRHSFSPFANFMHQVHTRPYGISKYCIGSAMLVPYLKKNMFKPILLSIKKICKDELPDIITAAS